MSANKHTNLETSGQLTLYDEARERANEDYAQLERERLDLLSDGYDEDFVDECMKTAQMNLLMEAEWLRLGDPIPHEVMRIYMNM